MPEWAKHANQLADAARHRRHRRNRRQWRNAIGLNRRSRHTRLTRRLTAVLRAGRLELTIAPSRTRSI